MYRHELKATVPRKILECSAVSREINFTSKQEIRQFRLEQRVFLAGACIEGAPSALRCLVDTASVCRISVFRLGPHVMTNPSPRPPLLPLYPEEWFFDFGFVIPGSTNSWQQTIESAGEDRMLSAEDLRYCRRLLGVCLLRVDARNAA